MSTLGPPAEGRVPGPDLFDTHTHLHFPDFARDLPEVLARARAGGLTGMLTVGTDVETSHAAVALAAREPDVWATVGIHPHDAAAADADAIRAISELAQAPRVVAVGEIGLDYFRDFSPRPDQARVFRALLEVARAAGKPVVLHCRDPRPDTRDAHEDLLRILGETHAGEGDGGIMHCFSGDAAIAQRALDLGLVISIAGPVTYPNARALPEVVRQVPADRLVVETDCPYLPPQPHRGQRNEPAHVAITARRIAELRQEPFEDVARRTSAAARKVLRIP